MLKIRAVTGQCVPGYGSRELVHTMWVEHCGELPQQGCMVEQIVLGVVYGI